MNTVKIWVSKLGLERINVTDLYDPKNNDWMLFTNTDMSDCGYTQVGTGIVECSFYSRDEIQQGAIESLKAQVQEVRAKAENDVMKLQDQISQLLAITA
jgi:hypothetical protein